MVNANIVVVKKRPKTAVVVKRDRFILNKCTNILVFTGTLVVLKNTIIKD